MTEKQFKRANGAVFPVIAIIVGYFAFSMIAWAMTHGVNWRTWMQLGASVGALAVSTAVYIAKKGTQICGRIMLLAAVAAYTVISFVGTTKGTWVYAFPVLFASMAYLNSKIIITGNCVVIAVNVIRAAMDYVNYSGSYLSSDVIALITICLVAYASIRITGLLNQFNEENMAVIREEARMNEEAGRKMASVAEKVTAYFEKAMSMLEELKSNIDSSNFAMSNIADSTESTSEAIQKQVVMCSQIQSNTDAAEAGTRKMIESSQRADTMVKEGADALEELKKQARNVEKASDVTVEVIERLTGKVEKVQGIVGTILNISSQTNLLALNASIEAARAGEAGKGFAVVAEEIRQLSEQTKAASNNITNIIKELNEDTGRANASIENSVDSVARQNELIESTREKFEKMGEEVSELVRNIRDTELIVGEILDSTGVISDKITHLSATCEEVAASSAEGLRVSEVTVEDMAKTKEILENIYKLAQELNQPEK